MNAHASNIARTCYFALRRLASIRRFLTSTATATLVTAFVLSRIDYCNSLLFDSTHDVIHLRSLHWLLVKARSTYKMACLCYHYHSSTAASCVADILHGKPLHTRSSSCTMPLLTRPAHSRTILGDSSSTFASSVWNFIPNDVRCAPSLSSSKSRLILASFSLHRLNCILDHCTYLHGLALSLLC